MSGVRGVFPLVTEEPDEGLVLQAILVLFPTIAMPLYIALGDSAASCEPLAFARRGGDGLNSLS